MSQQRIDAINKVARRNLQVEEENADTKSSPTAGYSHGPGEEEAPLHLINDGHRVAKGLAAWRRNKRSSSRRFRNTDGDDFEILENEGELSDDVDLGNLILQVQIQAQDQSQHERNQQNDTDSHRHAAENASADIEWAQTSDELIQDDKAKKAAALAYPTKYLLDVLNNLRERLLKMPQETALAPMIWQAMHDEIDTLSAQLPPYNLANVRRQLINHTTPCPPDAPAPVRTYHLLLPLILLQATCPRPKSHIQRAHALLNTMQIATEINSSEVRKCASSFAS